LLFVFFLAGVVALDRKLVTPLELVRGETPAKPLAVDRPAQTPTPGDLVAHHDTPQRDVSAQAPALPLLFPMK